MPTFNYTARDREGNATAGSVAAGSIDEVRRQLRTRELFLTAVTQQGEGAAHAAGLVVRRGKVTLGDLVVMSRQLAVLVRAGIPIVDAIHATAAQTESPGLYHVLNEVRVDVLTGQTLSDAMAKHPRVFNELYVSLVQAGEAGGVLEETLDTAAEQFEHEAELREKVKSAAVYPIIVMIAAVLVVSFMLIFIVPVFARVYAQFNAQLPAITRMLVWLSDIVVGYWWIVLLLALVLYFLGRKYVSTPKGRARYDRLKLRLPLFGKLYRKIAIARFTRTLAAVVKAGVPILKALSISANTSGSTVFVDAVWRVTQFVKEGASLSAPLEQTGEFPPLVTRMIAAGEQSGNLDEMLEHITRFYDRDIEYSVARLTRLMEPLMTIFVGGIVLFVLLALYMPVFSLTQVLRTK